MKNLLLISLVLILLDQITKFYFPGITNTGGAFGILKGLNLVFIVVSFLVLGFVFYYLKKTNKYEFVLIFSGTIGNLIDRLFFGHVRDFIDLKIWPVFNLADVYNTIGVFLIIFYLLKEKKAYM